MRKLLFVFLTFICFRASSQVVQQRLGVDGKTYQDTVYALANTVNKYFTGYGVFGSLIDTTRSYFSATSPLSYSAGVFSLPLTYTAGTVYYGNGTTLTSLAPGTSSQILHGGTTPSWKDTTAGGGGGSAAGSNTQIQYNNSGSFGASAAFTFIPSATITSKLARSILINPTLTSIANGDTLSALDIYPIFSTGATSSLSKSALRVYGVITLNRNNLNLDSTSNNSTNPLSIHQIQYDGTYDTWRFGGTNGIKFINESAATVYQFTGSQLTVPGLSAGSGTITTNGTLSGGSVTCGSNAFTVTYPGISATSRVNCIATGQTGFKLIPSPTAIVHLGYGTQVASSASLKFSSGAPTTAASGTGTTATITFTNSYTFAAPTTGDLITISGVTPTGYNGTYAITSSSGTTVSYANTTTGAQTVAGTVGFLLHTPENGAVEYDGNNFYGTNYSGVRQQFNHVTGQTTLVSGTKAITVSGLTTSSKAFVTLVSIGGTVTTTWQYAAVCTANTVTITALTNAGTADTSDTSVLNYEVVQ